MYDFWNLHAPLSKIFLHLVSYNYKVHNFRPFLKFIFVLGGFMPALPMKIAICIFVT